MDDVGFAGVLMDLTEAFECLSHDLLSKKFNFSNYAGSALALFHSYPKAQDKG